MAQKPLPKILPKDTTPNTHSATLTSCLVLPADAMEIIDAQVKAGAAAAKDATTLTVAALTTAIPAGTVLDFGGVPVVVTTAAAAGAVELDIEALPAALANAAAATFHNYDEVPLAENFNATLNDDEETIKVHGRFTPIRSKNGVDFTATIKTVAGADDPVIARLIEAGMQPTPGCRRRLVFVWSDGFALLVTVNIGAPKPSGNPGQSMRYDFAANLAGHAYWTNLNDPAPVWKPVGQLAT
ncbi:hypothetical protein Dxin01_02767 [Deinococcus xinjiangensis]|uniref:Uncharacterized protein n=1 Tax=Deinococcus xinjiangensis TaxID=457454 RepID=A0ABP9VI25_9DEIO